MRTIVKTIIRIYKQLNDYIYYILKVISNFNKKVSKSVVNINPILIVGNGPSAVNINYVYDKLNSIDYLCVNDFYLNEDLFFKIKPKFYCCIDPDYYIENKINAKFYDIFNRVNWKLTFICLASQQPKFNNNYVEIFKLNNNIFNGNPSKINFYLLNNNLCHYGFQNVICAALCYTIITKTEIVYLYGIDNDWHRELYIDENCDVIRAYRHFYDINDINNDDANKVNVVKTRQIKKGEFYKYIYWYYLTLLQFYKYSLLAKYNNVKIYNLNRNSYIDVFEKIKLFNDWL